MTDQINPLAPPVRLDGYIVAQCSVDETFLSLKVPLVTDGPCFAQADFDVQSLDVQQPIPTGSTLAQGKIANLSPLRTQFQNVGGSGGQATSSLTTLYVRLSGTTVTSANFVALVQAITQALTGTLGGQATSTVSLRILLTGTTIAQGSPSATLQRLLFVTGSVVAQAKASPSTPGSGVFMAGIVVGQATVTMVAHFVRADLGSWPAGAYVLRTKCRTDLTTRAAVLTVTVQVAGRLAVQSPLYAPADTISASYPTQWVDYDAECVFNLSVQSQVSVIWANDLNFHAAGKHLWIKGAQLHRVS